MFVWSSPAHWGTDSEKNHPQFHEISKNWEEVLTVAGVEIQSDKYKHGLPDILPAWYRPLPFYYESTGIETRFTNYLDPDACSRRVFSFHRLETLAACLKDEHHVTLDRAAEAKAVYNKPSTLIQIATGSGKTFAAVNVITALSGSEESRECSCSLTGQTWAARPKKNSTSTNRPTVHTNSLRNTSSSSSSRTRSTRPPGYDFQGCRWGEINGRMAQG